MRFLKSLGFAIQGLKQAVREEKNFKTHAVLAVLALLLGLLFRLDWQEWLWVFMAITVVVITELINTAIETCVNLVSPGYHLLAKKAKDIAAAAVLVAAIFALSVGIVIFFPKIASLIFSF